MKRVAMENPEIISWLENWYALQCDGVREHSYGMRFLITDNLRWSVTIDLKETKLQDLIMTEINIHRSNSDWLSCEVKANKFIAQCHAKNFSEVLSIFRKWVMQHS